VVDLVFVVGVTTHVGGGQPLPTVFGQDRVAL
jgi:hypothetical protein